MMKRNLKLKTRYEFVKNQIQTNGESKITAKGCQTNCVGCVGVS